MSKQEISYNFDPKLGAPLDARAQGSTAARPQTGQTGLYLGLLRYNTDFSLFEFYNGTGWVTLASAVGSTDALLQDGSKDINANAKLKYTDHWGQASIESTDTNAASYIATVWGNANDDLAVPTKLLVDKIIDNKVQAIFDGVAGDDGADAGGFVDKIHEITSLYSTTQEAGNFVSLVNQVKSDPGAQLSFGSLLDSLDGGSTVNMPSNSQLHGKNLDELRTENGTAVTLEAFLQKLLDIQAVPAHAVIGQAVSWGKVQHDNDDDGVWQDIPEFDRIVEASNGTQTTVATQGVEISSTMFKQKASFTVYLGEWNTLVYSSAGRTATAPYGVLSVTDQNYPTPLGQVTSGTYTDPFSQQQENFASSYEYGNGVAGYSRHTSRILETAAYLGPSQGGYNQGYTYAATLGICGLTSKTYTNAVLGAFTPGDPAYKSNGTTVQYHSSLSDYEGGPNVGATADTKLQFPTITLSSGGVVQFGSPLTETALAVVRTYGLVLATETAVTAGSTAPIQHHFKDTYDSAAPHYNVNSATFPTNANASGRAATQRMFEDTKTVYLPNHKTSQYIFTSKPVVAMYQYHPGGNDTDKQADGIMWLQDQVQVAIGNYTQINSGNTENSGGYQGPTNTFLVIQTDGSGGMLKEYYMYASKWVGPAREPEDIKLTFS
jgi:hypothetical protein